MEATVSGRVVRGNCSCVGVVGHPVWKHAPARRARFCFEKRSKKAKTLKTHREVRCASTVSERAGPGSTAVWFRRGFVATPSRTHTRPIPAKEQASHLLACVAVFFTVRACASRTTSREICFLHSLTRTSIWRGCRPGTRASCGRFAAPAGHPWARGGRRCDIGGTVSGKGRVGSATGYRARREHFFCGTERKKSEGRRLRRRHHVRHPGA